MIEQRDHAPSHHRGDLLALRGRVPPPRRAVEAAAGEEGEKAAKEADEKA